MPGLRIEIPAFFSHAVSGLWAQLVGVGLPQLGAPPLDRLVAEGHYKHLHAIHSRLGGMPP